MVIDYVEKSRRFYGNLLLITGNSRETNKDIQDYREGKIKYPEIKRKYSLKMKKSSFEGAIRLSYNYLQKSNIPQEQVRGKEILQAWKPQAITITAQAGKTINQISLWNSLFGKYNTPFTDEMILELPEKPFASVGFYETIADITFKQLLDNPMEYLKNVGNIIRDLGRFFKGSYFNNEYYTDAYHYPVVVRIRIFYQDAYTSEEYCFQSGYLEFNKWFELLISFIEKYFDTSKDMQDWYDDNPEMWIIKYICVDTKMYSISKFTEEYGNKAGIYINYIQYG